MKKKFLAFATVFALAAVAVVGGTMAYFTDTKSETNQFTVGNVSVELIEQEYVDGELDEFHDDKVLMPGEQNAQDKIVTVKNTGDNPAYVRVKITVPAALKNVIHLVQEEETDWTELDPTDDTEGNLVYTSIFERELAGKTVVDDKEEFDISDVVLSKVYLDATVNKDADGYYYVVTREDQAQEKVHIELDPADVDIEVVVEAIQSEGFDDAEEAFATYDSQF